MLLKQAGKHLIRVLFVSCSGISLNGLLRVVEKCKYETKETL